MSRKTISGTGGVASATRRAASKTARKAAVPIAVLVAFAVQILIPAAIVGVGSLAGCGGAGGEGSGEAFDSAEREGVRMVNMVKLPEKIKVWREAQGRYEEVDFEEYVVGVVASEMPAGFHPEALKAQAVAARTYAVAKLEKSEAAGANGHGEAALCDTVHCQVYRSDLQLRALHEEKWYSGSDGIKKIRDACAATRGELLYYGGQLVMQPLFFSSSGGQTENSEDVFSGAYPYLVSVSSPYEEKATHRNEKKTMGLADFAAAMRAAFPDEPFGDISAAAIEILERTAGGRVKTMRVGDVVLKGTQVRSALKLSSALFSLSFGEDDRGGETVIFTSDGAGHGVGMSQYGADGMALEGFTYKEILSHFYSGTEVF